MTVYITPDQKETFSKKIYNMSKHLTKMPNIEFSEPKKMEKITTEIYNNGYDGWGKCKEYVEVIEVTIDDIDEGDWVLVASVYYQEGIVTPINMGLYEKMPSQFGLTYSKCDYCGKSHSSRKTSHIIYNKVTGEWKQIGSTCVTKMFSGSDYLNKFTVQLYKIVEICFGCADFLGLGGWIANLPDHHLQQAVDIDFEIMAVKSYRDNVSPLWEKTQWIGNTKILGTTHKFDEYFSNHYDEFKHDEEYCSRVKEYVNSLEDTSEFIHNIKEVFSFGHVFKYDVYAVFFAAKMYEDSLTSSDWETYKESIRGKKLEFKNLVVKSTSFHDSFFGPCEEYIFEDSLGNYFSKSVSDSSVLESFKNSDDTYSFKGTVEYFDDNKRIAIIKGRLSKVK